MIGGAAARRIATLLCAQSALVCLAVLGTPAFAQLPPATDTHGWQTAPASGGAISWGVFAAAKMEVVNQNGLPVFVAKLTPELEKLDGQKLRLNGFMMPLEPADHQSHFLLLAYPLSCPFHLSIGGTQIVEVKSAEPVRFSYEPVLLEGTFRLTDPASSGMIYLLEDARLTAPGR